MNSFSKFDLMTKCDTDIIGRIKSDYEEAVKESESKGYFIDLVGGDMHTWIVSFAGPVR